MPLNARDMLLVDTFPDVGGLEAARQAVHLSITDERYLGESVDQSPLRSSRRRWSRTLLCPHVCLSTRPIIDRTEDQFCVGRVLAAQAVDVEQGINELAEVEQNSVRGR